MNLIETTPLLSADFPIAELKDYLRLSIGFTDDNVQDGQLELCLRAAMGAIETRTSKVLLKRMFDWKFFRYRVVGDGILLPISPLVWLSEFNVYDRSGAFVSYPKNDFQLSTDAHRPRLIPKSGTLPGIPDQGWVLVRVVAGYGVWAAVPKDLQLAMLILAASYYENREAMISGGAQMPLTVATLVAPYQRIRLGARI